MTPQQLLLADQNYFLSYSSIVGNMPRGHIDKTLFYTDSGTNALFMNNAVLRQPYANAGGQIEACLAHFSAVQRPVQFIFRAGCKQYFEPFLHSFGLKETLGAPLMHHSSIASLPAIDDIDWHEVDNPSTLSDYCSVVADAYELPDWLVPKILTENFVQQEHVKMVVAYIGDSPAAAAMMIKENDLAGVYWVGTKKNFERQGLAAKVTQQAVYLGAQMGCRESILQASKKGKPVYERMGYTVADYYQYVVYEPTG